MFGGYKEVDPAKIQLTGLAAAALAVRRAVTAYLPEQLRPSVYGIALVGGRGAVWPGSLYTTAGYDAITPALAAIQTWRNTLDPEKAHHTPNRVVVASYDGLPNVLYRDRQGLLELDEILRVDQPQRESLRVDLLRLDPGTDRIAQAATTSATEWLPFPFSLEAFGMHDALRQQQEKLFNQRT